MRDETHPELQSNSEEYGVCGWCYLKETEEINFRIFRVKNPKFEILDDYLGKLISEAADSHWRLNKW